jgi:hypothetical protein
MQTVVIVSPTPTHPIDFGNRKRIHRMAAELKRAGFRVHFILFALEQDWREDFPEESYLAMKEEWDEFHVVRSVSPYHKSSEGEDHKLDEWWDDALEKFLWWYLRSRPVDAVIVNYVYLSRALTLAHPHTLKILDTHDKFSGRREMLAELDIGPEFFHIDERNEKKGISRADIVLAIKPQEKVHFEKLGAEICLTVPFSEPPKFFPAPTPDSDGYLRVGLIGGRNNINRGSTERFLTHAVPAFFAVGAPVKIVLAGTMCIDLAAWASKFCVQLLGPVDDVEVFYRAVDCVVVPMELSSGQKIKLGEALGFGVPVVATAHAFEGYAPKHPHHECETIEEVTQALIDLAFDRGSLARLKAASEMASAQQEVMVEAGVSQLVNAIRYSKPQTLIMIDQQRFESDPLFRSHLALIIEFAAAGSSTVIRFDGDGQIETGHGTISEFRRIRRRARVVGADVPLGSIFANYEVMIIWDYGKIPTDIASHAPEWNGVLASCSSFVARGAARGSVSPPSMIPAGVGQIDTWYGAVSDLRTTRGRPQGFPCHLYAAESLEKCFRRFGETALFVFGVTNEDADRVREIVRTVAKAGWIQSLIVVTQDSNVAQDLQLWSEREHLGVRLCLIDEDEELIRALEYRPVARIDLSAAGGFASALRIAVSQLGVPSFACRGGVADGGLEICRGTSDLDLFNWLLEFLANVGGDRTASGSVQPRSEESGLAAVFSFLKNFTDSSGLGRRSPAKWRVSYDPSTEPHDADGRAVGLC